MKNMTNKHRNSKHFRNSSKLIFFVFCFLFLISDTKADQLSDVSFSVNGDRFLSRNRNKISVWETDTGILLRTFETATTAFKFAAFLPDGKTVFAVNYKAEMLWLDIETGESKNKISGKAVYPYAISADGETVASASNSSADGEIIELYDIRNGTLKKSFQYKLNGFVCLAFFPNDKKLLAVSNDMFIISLQEGKIEKSFDSRLPFLNCAVSTRGDSVLGSNPFGTTEINLQIYSLEKNRKYFRLEKEYKEQIGDIGAVGYSPNDPDLAFAAGTNRQTDGKSGKGLFVLWNIKSGKIKQTIKTVNPLASAALSADGENVLVQEISGHLTLFKLETGAVIRKYADKTEILCRVVK